MKKILLTREFHPGIKWVEFHHGMKFNLKEKLPLSMMKTYNKISHFCQSLKSDAWYVKNIRRIKARYIKWLRLNPEACNFIKKDTLALAFSCEFCQISNTCFTEHLWESASILHEGRRLKQIEISIISKLHKEDNNKKNFLHFFYFLLVVLILFLFGLHFLQWGLMFHYIQTFIMFKGVEFGKHTWMRTPKIKKACSF